MKKIILFQHSNKKKPTAQASFLSGFFANKAQNPSNSSNSGNHDLIERNPNRRYVIVESLSSARERSTIKTKLLTNFSAKKVQYPDYYPSYYFNIKLKFTL